MRYDLCSGITIVGVGYVGLTLGLVLADNGFRVVGFDINPDLVNTLRDKQSSFFEHNLSSFMERNVGKNLTFSSDIKECISDIYIITVSTPVENDLKKPDLTAVKAAAKCIGGVLKKNDMVLLRSTLPIGCSRNVVIADLENISGLQAGKDFLIACTPERTAEGVALTELYKNPQIIGGFNNLSAERAKALFETIAPACHIVRSLEAAEMCKLMDNTYRDHVFAYVNQLVPLADAVGVDLVSVIKAANSGYSRNNIPLPSPGVGGACLSKDPYILSDCMRKLGIDASLVLAGRSVNEGVPQYVRNKLSQLLASVGKDMLKAKIFIVGLAFKGEPETSDLRASTSIDFLNLLPNKANVKAYDPVVEMVDINNLGVQYSSLKQGFLGADVAVFLNNHKSYCTINLDEYVPLMNRPAVLFDAWRVFNLAEIKKQEGIVYGSLGYA